MTRDSLGPRLPELHRPSVSIVVCNYNYGRFVEQAVRSALEQSYRCEVIVVDDGSTDDSRQILTRFQERAEVLLQANAGQRAAYSTGFARATGDVVVFLDSDDYLLPDAAERLSHEFKLGVAKVHYRLELVDDENRRLGSAIPKRLANGDALRRLTKHGLLYPSAPGSGNAYRRDVLQLLFPLPEDPIERHAADFFMVYGAIAFGTVRAIPDVLGGYRVHARAESASDAFRFGNAVKQFDEAKRNETRIVQYREWMTLRTSGRVTIPQEVFDFSQAKTLYAQQVFNGSYADGVRAGVSTLPQLMRALWLDEDFPVIWKLALTSWAAVVLLSPRGLGRPLALYVSNPASRRS